MFALISAALAGVNAYSNASVTKAQVEANNRLSAAQADNDNRVRGAGNAFAAARGSLSRYIQSLNNNQTLEAGGAALEENLINSRRREDTMSSASFEDQIKDAEQTGAQAAAAAFAGVGGEVADTVSVSTRLMQQRASLEALRSRDFRIYDDARRAGVIQTQTVRGLDQSLIFDSLDYSINVAQRNKAPSVWGQTAFAVAGSLLGNNGLGLQQAGSAMSQGKQALFRASGSGSTPMAGNNDMSTFI